MVFSKTDRCETRICISDQTSKVKGKEAPIVILHNFTKISLTILRFALKFHEDFLRIV